MQSQWYLSYRCPLGLQYREHPCRKTQYLLQELGDCPQAPSPSLCWSGPVTAVGEALHGPLLLLSLWPRARVTIWPLATSVWCVIPQDMNLSWAAKPFYGLTLFFETAEEQDVYCMYSDHSHWRGNPLGWAQLLCGKHLLYLGTEM